MQGEESLQSLRREEIRADLPTCRPSRRFELWNALPIGEGVFFCIKSIEGIETNPVLRYSPLMDEKPRRLPLLLTWMSARLLLLTVFFVMLSEVFI